MKSIVLLLALLLALCGYGQNSSGQESAPSLNRTAEQVQLAVPAGRAESEMSRVEQLVNHLGGTILHRGKTNGSSELLARIPAENVPYFRENVRGPSAQSSSARASADQVFQVVVLAQ